MRGYRFGAVAARVGAWCLATLVAGCGGGSGGAGSPSSGAFSATFSPAALDTSTIQGSSDPANFSATLSYTGTSTLYLVADGDPAIVSAVSGSVSGNTLTGTVTLRGDLSPGSYSTQLKVLACLDQQCTRQVAGSPVALPITYVVQPNIQVQQQVTLQRTGQDPAPSVALPVTVPPAAGTVQLSVTGRTDAIYAIFGGTSLVVTTAQVRAGQYTLQATLQGSSDPRYHQTVTITYTVNPPAGGEQPLSVSPVSVNLYAAQGTTATQIFTVTRPTWTSTLDPPQIFGTADPFVLTDLGNGQYQVSLNTSNLVVGLHSANVQFSAGATGGTATAYVYVNVVTAFYPTGNFNITLDATTASPRYSSPVVTVDGVAANWSATTTTSWLTLPRSTGVTGVDMVELQIDPTFGGTPYWSYSGWINLSIDRAGTSPLSVPVSVGNYVPRLDRSVAALAGSAGRIYVEGALSSTYSALLSSGALHVTGANLVSAQYRDDHRFVGDVTELAVDVNGAVAGQPITIAAVTPLESSQVAVAVKAPVQVPQGYLSLPYGNYRPSAYAPGMDAFYFSGLDTIYRWAQAGGAWTLSQATISGVSGVALRPDEQRLYAVAGNMLQALDPISFAALASNPITGGAPSPIQFDAAGPPGTAALSFASDDRLIASLVAVQNGQRTACSAHWIGSASAIGTFTGTRDLIDPTVLPGIADPDQGYWSNMNLQTGVALVASPSRHVILGTDAGGAVSFYQPSLAAWSAGVAVPAGSYMASVSDDAKRVVRSDGEVFGSGSDQGNLSSIVPLTHSAGGFGLTQDGRYGLVYGYQIMIENGAQRARNPTLWLVDMSQVPATPLASAPVVATIALTDAVGCTAAPLAPGETCAHSASVTLSPGSGSAFVLGPRALAAVPLPSSVVVMTAAAHGAASPQPRSADTPRPSSTRIARPIGIFR